MVIDFEKQIIRNKPSRLWRAFLARREMMAWAYDSDFHDCSSRFKLFFHIYKFIAENRDRRAFFRKSFRQEIRLALGVMWLARANMSFQPVLQVDVGFIFHSFCVDDYLGSTPGGCWADQVERGLEVLSTAGASKGCCEKWKQRRASAPSFATA